MPAIPADTKLMGSRQFENGWIKMLPSRTALTIPSFVDCVIPLSHGYYGLDTYLMANGSRLENVKATLVARGLAG
jgi:hypothetical protein